MCKGTKIAPSNDTYILKQFEQTEGIEDQGIETALGMKVKVIICKECHYVGLMSAGKIYFN